MGGYLPVYNNNNQLINVSIKQVQLEQDSGKEVTCTVHLNLFILFIILGKIVFGEKTLEGHDTLLDYKRAGN